MGGNHGYTGYMVCGGVHGDYLLLDARLRFLIHKRSYRDRGRRVTMGHAVVLPHKRKRLIQQMRGYNLPVLALCMQCNARFVDYSGKGLCSDCVGKPSLRASNFKSFERR